MTSRLFPLCLALVIAASVSSFTLVEAENTSSKSEEGVTSVEEASASKENSKEKRSQEEVLFGNQQNKPNGLVDDLMDNGGEEEDDTTVTNKKESDSSNESKDDDKSDGVLQTESGSDNWYSPVPDSTKAMQYLANSPAIKLPTDDFPASLYDREDLYRRKRQLPLPLFRRKRQLRSSLGQMIQKRGIRLPRRSMRLKRQVDMGDLLGLIDAQRMYEEPQPQLTPHIFGGRSQTVAKRRVPSVFSSYPETPEFRIPYVFHHDLPSGDPEDAEEDDDNMEDINELMLLPPNSRMPLDEKEAFQKWLALHTVPSSPRLQRRSSSFYPLDYRYVIPEGYRKRSVFSHGNRRGSSHPGESEPGKWGHVVQVPEAYASPEDIARLYGLAGLMAGEEEEGERRRRAV